MEQYSYVCIMRMQYACRGSETDRSLTGIIQDMMSLWRQSHENILYAWNVWVGNICQYVQYVQGVKNCMCKFIKKYYYYYA